MNNINIDLVNKKFSKIEAEIARMDPRDLIQLQDEIVNHHPHNLEEDYYGVSGFNYGNQFLKEIYSIPRNELLKIINGRLFGKETNDYLESITTPNSMDSQGKKR